MRYIVGTTAYMLLSALLLAQAAHLRPGLSQSFGSADVSVANTCMGPIIVVVYHSSEFDAKDTDEWVFVMYPPPENPLPKPWSGLARIYVGQSTLALIGENGPNLLFHVPPKDTMLASLDQWRFSDYPITGVARFGDSGPLDPKLVEYLKKYGSSTCGQKTRTSRMTRFVDISPLDPISNNPVSNLVS